MKLLGLKNIREIQIVLDSIKEDLNNKERKILDKDFVSDKLQKKLEIIKTNIDKIGSAQELLSEVVTL